MCFSPLRTLITVQEREDPGPGSFLVKRQRRLTKSSVTHFRRVLCTR